MNSETDQEIFDPVDFQNQIENRDLLIELIKSFPEESSCHLKSAREALEEGDFDSLYFAALSLKVLAGNYIGLRAFAAAEELEETARKRRFEESIKAFAICEKEIHSLKRAIARFEIETLEDRYAAK